MLYKYIMYELKTKEEKLVQNADTPIFSEQTLVVSEQRPIFTSR